MKTFHTSAASSRTHCPQPALSNTTVQLCNAGRQGDRIGYITLTSYCNNHAQTTWTSLRTGANLRTWYISAGCRRSPCFQSPFTIKLPDRNNIVRCTTPHHLPHLSSQLKTTRAPLPLQLWERMKWCMEQNNLKTYIIKCWAFISR